jgi:hypothetical protein
MSASCAFSVSTSKVPPKALGALDLGLGSLDQLV